MIRTGVLAVLLASASGCSLILDFSGESAPPVDAAYTQAECDYKEPNDTRATAAELLLTDVGPAAICSTTAGVDDRDFYKVTLPATSSVSFQISYVFSATGDLDMQLTDTQGSMLASSRSFDNDELIMCPGQSPPCVGPLPPGEYFLEVFPGQPGTGNRYDISIVIVP